MNEMKGQPVIRTRLYELMAEKAFKETKATGQNVKVNLAVVARDTNISRQTLTTWAKEPMEGFHSSTVITLCDYFGVEPGDLIYIDRQESAG